MRIGPHIWAGPACCTGVLPHGSIAAPTGYAAGSVETLRPVPGYVTAEEAVRAMPLLNATGQSGSRDIAYGPGPAQRLDLLVPAGKGYSTVLFVHGGSLSTGDKADEDYRDACKPFPAAGIACANANYRLAPQFAWPAQAEDVAAALAWVRANIGARGGDSRQLFLVGHSS